MNAASKNTVIEGVLVRDLRCIPDPRGEVLHMLRCDDPVWTRFGEIYFSRLHAGCIKAWRRHRRMTQHFAVPVGEVILVMFDDRNQVPSRGALQSMLLGEQHYSLVRVPPLVWYGFKTLSASTALIANCTDLPHDPDEIDRLGETDAGVPFRWDGLEEGAS